MKPLYPTKVQRMVEALEQSPGATVPALRRTVAARAAALSGAAREGVDGPANIAGYVENVALHAYRTSDDDIEALKRDGYSEDAILEITFSAAVGAGLARMEIGLSALHPDRERHDGQRRRDPVDGAR
jgi:hypothetical protein